MRCDVSTLVQAIVQLWLRTAAAPFPLAQERRHQVLVLEQASVGVGSCSWESRREGIWGMVQMGSGYRGMGRAV